MSEKKMMWAGRFSKQIDSRVNDFNSSIPFDCRMFEQDIRGSIAHATMLGKQGIIPQEDAQKIIWGLQAIREDIKTGALPIDMEAEDIHMFVEAELTKRIGTAGKRLHTARSRNDQVALDDRMYVADQIDELVPLVKEFVKTLCEKAQENLHTVMPGYTHLPKCFAGIWLG